MPLLSGGKAHPGWRPDPARQYRSVDHSAFPREDPTTATPHRSDSRSRVPLGWTVHDKWKN